MTEDGAAIAALNQTVRALVAELHALNEHLEAMGFTVAEDTQEDA